jgi:hypothetical protein
MCENQEGFSKGYSTTDNLFILHMFVNIMKCKKKKLFCVFIEFAATFDTVWRDGLWNKLLINQINGKMYNIICDMYSRIKSRVVYNCNKTEYFACNVGVSQDEHLFPFLFSLYLNDLELLLHDRNSKGLDSIAKDIEDELDIFLRLFILLYADDTVLFSDSVEDLMYS